MGRGRKSLVLQGYSKLKKECGPLPKGDIELFCLGTKNPSNQNIVALPEEFLKALGQMNPRDIANILVNFR